MEGQCWRDGDEKDGGRDRHRGTRMEGYRWTNGCGRRAGAGGRGQAGQRQGRRVRKKDRSRVAGAGRLGRRTGAGRQGREDWTGVQEQAGGAGARGWVCRGGWEPPPGVGDAARPGSVWLRGR